MNLKKYKQKINFKETSEHLEKKEKKKRIFVIQKHYATHLHYDFRLEIDGVLKSWAVPKGPPEKEKRLAVLVEDHSIKYAKFEGTILNGNYGAGKVEIWDSGTFENLRNISMKKSVEEGKIEIKLNGTKLKESYALIKLKPTLKYPGEKNWLWMKMEK